MFKTRQKFFFKINRSEVWGCVSTSDFDIGLVLLENILNATKLSFERNGVILWFNEFFLGLIEAILENLCLKNEDFTAENRKLKTI